MASAATWLREPVRLGILMQRAEARLGEALADLRPASYAAGEAARRATTARSEKQDKREYNRRYRRASRQAVGVAAESAGEKNPLPALREHSNPWDMGKDGKMMFDPREKPDLLRK